MAADVQKAIGAGDIRRDGWPGAGERRVPLYLGSGRCGACFDAWGLMHAGNPAGETTLLHADHFDRDAHGGGAWLPLARLGWADLPPAPPARYSQYLGLHDGRLTTELGWPGLSLTLTAQFHPGRRDVLGVDVRYESDDDETVPPALLLAPVTAPGGRFDATGPTAEGIQYAATVRNGTAETLLGLNVLRRDGSGADIHFTDAGARVEFTGRRGNHLILVAAGAPARGGTIADDLTAWGAERHAFADSATAAWHKLWGDARPDLPSPVNPRDDAMAARSLYYLLCSFAPESHAPAPPHGWSANGRLTHDPRAAAVVVPALLKFGHADIARGIVEFYQTTPLTSETAGLAAMMAQDASARLRDDAWSRGVAWPLVHEAARQFSLLLKEGPGGTWSLDDPALAPLARDSLRAAVAMAGELGVSGQEYANYRGVLSDGINQPPTSRGDDANPPEPPSDPEHVQFYGDGSGDLARSPYDLPAHARFLTRPA